MDDAFKVIPMSEALAAAPFLPPAEPVFTHEEIAEGYDRIAREGWGVRIEGHTGGKPASKAAYGRVSWDEVKRDLSSEEFARGVADLMSEDLSPAEPDAWNEQVFTNGASLTLRDLPDIEITLNPFWQPLTRRRRRRLRGGKTKQARPRFRPWDPRGPVTIARGAPGFSQRN